eukprot:PITA_28852
MSLMTELVETKPSSFEVVVEKLVWVDEMVEEYESIVNKSVSEVVPRPANKSVVGSIWIFKVKHATNESIEKYNAKYVAKCYSQVEVIDYEDTFYLVASDNKKLTLKDKLRSIKMQKNDTISQYLSKITQFHDELGRFSVNVLEEDLVSLALPGLPKSWHSYQD